APRVIRGQVGNSLLALASFAAFFCLPFEPGIRAGEPKPPTFVTEWGKQGAEPGRLDCPIGIAINSGDEVFVSDYYNNRVQKFDTSGKLLGHFPVLGNPGAIAIDRSGNLIISHLRASLRNKDLNKDCLTVYSPQGNLLRQWGKTGTGEVEFD